MLGTNFENFLGSEVLECPEIDFDFLGLVDDFEFFCPENGASKTITSQVKTAFKDYVGAFWLIV